MATLNTLMHGTSASPDRYYYMDTVEELNGTYFYHGLSNLSAGELLFWIFLDETAEQLGVKDYVALGGMLLGIPDIPTRGKPIGATLGTSPLSQHLRQILKVKVKNWPTITLGSARRMRFSYVRNLGAFVGRWIPVLGLAIIAADVSVIAYKATNKYNTIARGGDRIW
jgi:hypothetical protein